MNCSTKQDTEIKCPTHKILLMKKCIAGKNLLWNECVARKTFVRKKPMRRMQDFFDWILMSTLDDHGSVWFIIHKSQVGIFFL